MRRRLLYSLVAVSLVLVATAPSFVTTQAFAAPSPSIEGTWTANDSLDGSRMRL